MNENPRFESIFVNDSLFGKRKTIGLSTLLDMNLSSKNLENDTLSNQTAHFEVLQMLIYVNEAFMFNDAI